MASDQSANPSSTEAGTSTVSGDFGDAVLVLMKSPAFCDRRLPELRDLLLEPLDRGQLVVARGKTAQGTAYPIALACIARVSDDLHARMKAEPGSVALKGGDWQCGENLWFALAEGPQESLGSFLRTTREKLFPGKTVWFQAPDASGKMRASEVPGA